MFPVHIFRTPLNVLCLALHTTLALGRWTKAASLNNFRDYFADVMAILWTAGNIAFSCGETALCDFISQFAVHHFRSAKQSYAENHRETSDRYDTATTRMCEGVDELFRPGTPVAKTLVDGVIRPASTPLIAAEAAYRVTQTPLQQPYEHDFQRTARAMFVFGLLDGASDIAWMVALSAFLPGVHPLALLAKSALDVAVFKPIQMAVLMGVNGALAPIPSPSAAAAARSFSRPGSVVDTDSDDGADDANDARSATSRRSFAARSARRMGDSLHSFSSSLRTRLRQAIHVIKHDYPHVAFTNVAYWLIVDGLLFTLPLPLQVPFNKVGDFVLDMYILYVANRSLDPNATPHCAHAASCAPSLNVHGVSAHSSCASCASACGAHHITHTPPDDLHYIHRDRSGERWRRKERSQYSQLSSLTAVGEHPLHNGERKLVGGPVWGEGLSSRGGGGGKVKLYGGEGGGVVKTPFHVVGGGGDGEAEDDGDFSEAWDEQWEDDGEDWGAVGANESSAESSRGVGAMGGGGGRWFARWFGGGDRRRGVASGGSGAVSWGVKSADGGRVGVGLAVDGAKGGEGGGPETMVDGTSVEGAYSSIPHQRGGIFQASNVGVAVRVGWWGGRRASREGVSESDESAERHAGGAYVGAESGGKGQDSCRWEEGARRGGGGHASTRLPIVEELP